MTDPVRQKSSPGALTSLLDPQDADLEITDDSIVQIIDFIQSHAEEVTKLIGKDYLEDLAKAKKNLESSRENSEMAIAISEIRDSTIAQVKATVDLIFAKKDLFAMRERNQRLSEINGILEKKAQTDPLTNLHNKEGLATQGQRVFEHCKQNKIPLTCLYLDIDYFKNVNDSYGHDIGDMVLKQFSELIVNELRGYDVVGRQKDTKDTEITEVMGRDGGEEFVVLMPYTNASEAAIAAERLRKKIQNHSFGIIKRNGKTTTVNLRLTCSIGIAESDFSQDSSMDDVKKFADSTMLVGKSRYRNIVAVSSRDPSGTISTIFPSLKDPERIIPEKPEHSH